MPALFLDPGVLSSRAREAGRESDDSCAALLRAAVFGGFSLGVEPSGCEGEDTLMRSRAVPLMVNRGELLADDDDVLWLLRMSKRRFFSAGNEDLSLGWSMSSLRFFAAGAEMLGRDGMLL